jgi:carbonic anhydrase
MPKPQVITREWRDAQTPQSILEILKRGNAAFASGQAEHRDFAYAAEQTALAQYPMAIILNCIDSRAPAEIIFNLNIGDVFNARIAGNFANPDIVGSMEYACKVVGAKVIVVMGHTNCGAVSSACDGFEMGNITALLANLKPAVDAVRHIEGEHNSGNAAFVTEVAKQNVLITKERIVQLSPILKDLVDQNEILIAGCLYDLQSGTVHFL